MVNFNPKLVSGYNRIFPHSSFRRFLFSEFMKFTSNLVYYGTLLIGMAIILCAICYTSFKIVDYFYDLEKYKMPIPEMLAYGLAFTFLGCFFLGILIGTVVGIYQLDYSNWVKPKKTEVDLESLLESNPDKCKSLFLTLFPYYSVRRYLLIRSLSIIIFVLISSLYLYFCYNIVIYFFGYQWVYTKNPSTGKLEETPFAVVILICFMGISSFLAILGGLIALVVFYYMDSWKKYRVGAQQVVAKEN